MPSHTDSAIIEHNEDGSKTITTVETVYPLTKAQQAAGWAGLTLLCLAPATPLLAYYVAEKWEEQKEKRKQKKSLKSV